jgi:hypothetical protein
VVEPTVENGPSPEEIARALAGNHKVIVRKGKAEVHGYLVAAGETRAKVLWVCGTGRTQRRDVPLAELVIPSRENPWQGIEISLSDLVAATERRRSRVQRAGPRSSPARSSPDRSSPPRTSHRPLTP